MTLAAGARLGPYEILSPLGAGGMGEVYRARDAKLGREVAVKVLPAELSGELLHSRGFSGSRGVRELIYRTGPNNEQFMAVEVVTRPTLAISSPQLMFKSELMPGNTVDASREYDVSADGNEFFAVRAASQTDPERRLVVVTEVSSTQPR